jgi:hypothetical protein
MTRDQEIELAYLERRIQEMADATCPADDDFETVCPGCCRMASDTVLTVLIDEPMHFLAEQRCGACRASMSRAAA